MLGIDLVELGDGLDALVEDIERHVFIGRVDSVALQSEAHEDGLDTEDALEGRDDGDAPATAYGQRTLAEGYAHSLLSSLVGGEVNGAEVGLAAVHRGDLDADVLRCDALDVVDEGLAHLMVILVRYEAAGDLGVGLGGEDGLGAFALIAAPDAADVEARATAIALQRVVALLTEEGVDVEELLVLLLVEGDLGDHGALLVRQVDDRVIEVGDGDAPVGVLHLGDELAELVDGIGHRTAEVTRVQVVVGPCHLDLPVG